MYSKDFVENVKEIYKTNKNLRETSRNIRKPYSTVHYMIKNDYNRIKKKRGPKKIINSREKTKIKRVFKVLKDKNQKITAKKIKIESGIDASISTIQRALADLNLTYGEIPKKLPLTKEHKLKRVELAKKWIAENLITKNIVFTDEKRFKFDGPDNWCSWYDPFDPPLRVKRQMGGGGIMTWGMTLPDGEILVERLEGKVDSSKYISLIKNRIKPYLNSRFKDNNYVFQQDNCKVHVSKKTLKYLKSAKIELLEWPSMSPDMNIQENIWHIISELVYDQKQFDNKESLWNAIVEAVDKINATKKDTIKKIYDNYNRRLLNVIENNGKDIPY